MFGFRKKKNKEEDPLGQIRRYESTPDSELIFDETEFAEAIRDHVERFAGPPKDVFHELISDHVHLDVLVVDPIPSQRDYVTLVTSGMSARPMTLPPDFPEPLQWERAELVMYLPADWPLSQEAIRDEANFWPIGWLKEIARLPHLYDTFFLPGHTIPNGDPPEPLAEGTTFCGFVLWPGTLEEADFDTLDLGDGRQLQFYGLLPLYESEMAFKLSKGFDALADRMVKRGASFVVDINRPAVA